MALLAASNAVFYHPLNNRVESLQAKTWTLYGTTTAISVFGRPFLTSGLLNNDSVAGTLYGNTSEYGGYPTGCSSLTAAFWMSGVNSGNKVTVGWGTTSFVSPKTGLGIIHNASTSTVRVNMYSSGSVMWSGIGLTIPNDPAWVVVRVGWSGDTTFCAWASFNGSGWQFAGSGEKGKPEPTGSLIGVHTYEQSTGGVIGVDEVVLWKDAEMFSSRELERLYLLSNTDGKPMDQFTQNYGWTIVRSSGTLFIHGKNQHSGAMPLFTSQGFAFHSAPLYCCNDSTASGSLDLFTKAPTYYGEDYLQWYHPLSSVREQYKETDWNAWTWRVPPTYGPYANTPQFGAAARGFGLSPSTAQVLGSVESVYTSGYASGSIPLPWFMTQWVSGLCRPTAFIRQGWASESVVKSEFPYNGLTDFISFSYHNSSGMKIAAYGGKRLAVSGILPYSEDRYRQWHFIATYLEYEYSGVDIVALNLWASLDADEWVKLGSASGSTFQIGTYDTPPWYPQIEIQDNVSSPMRPSGAVDEAACWKGLPERPSQQALHTLYRTTMAGLGLDSFYAMDTGFELGTVPMFISGPVVTSGSCNLYIKHNPRNSIPLFVSGTTPYGQWPLVLRTDTTSISGSVTLQVYGSASGSTFGHSAAMPLFVGFAPDENDDWWYHPTYVAGPSAWPMFVKAGTWDEEIPVSGVWSLVMRAGGFCTGHCTLSMSGSASGVNEGRVIYSGTTLHTAGWNPGQLDDGLSDGFYPLSSGFGLVLARPRGAIGELALTMSGFAWPSGSVACRTFGILGSHNDDMNLFAASYSSVATSCTCIVNGFTGGCSGAINMTLALPETGVAYSIDPCKMYVHGF